MKRKISDSVLIYNGNEVLSSPPIVALCGRLESNRLLVKAIRFSNETIVHGACTFEQLYRDIGPK